MRERGIGFLSGKVNGYICLDSDRRPTRKGNVNKDCILRYILASYMFFNYLRFWPEFDEFNCVFLVQHKLELPLYLATLHLM